ncbi:MAG: T9SS type A sorting domain-containing protein, partial [Ferruginibacter sp.]|nr:T9SS type A sorting domain-containing protein [Ferruginibacter sp.]
VRVRYNTVLTGANACTTYVFGETEDYSVNIIPCIQGVFNTQPASASVTCGNSATFTSAATGTFLSYQWQQQVSATAPWTTVLNGGGISGATSNTLTIANINSGLTGYRYRVVISGGCTAVDFSSVATLTVDPLVITVNTSSYSSCTPIPPGSPIQLSITNVSGVSSSTTTSYTSGPIAPPLGDIPDLDDVVGITNAITVPALPAGSVITGATVTLNVRDAFVGDLIFALKAPNGNVLNLDYALTSTGGPGITTGFAGTVISSTGTATLVSGTDPWTGIFAPDAVAAPVAGIPSSPTSLSPGNANVFTFAGLYSIPDGVWTLGVFDYASPDAGTLLDWTITLTYSTTTSTPLTGVWSPATGLFLDPAGTIPYVAGTEENTVYAAPSASTNYTITVTNATCPAAPLVIPFKILSPDPTITVSLAPYTHLYPGLITNATSNITPSPSSAATYQWFANGIAIPGANSANYQADVDAIGELSLEVTDSTPCSGKASGSVTLFDSTSTTLFIYPNPNNGVFQVRFNGGANDLQQKPRILTIYDSKGSRVFSKTYAVSAIYQRMDVDLSKLPKGIYVIDLTDVSGKRLQSERVITH